MNNLLKLIVLVITAANIIFTLTSCEAEEEFSCSEVTNVVISHNLLNGRNTLVITTKDFVHKTPSETRRISSDFKIGDLYCTYLKK